MTTVEMQWYSVEEKLPTEEDDYSEFTGVVFHTTEGEVFFGNFQRLDPALCGELRGTVPWAWQVVGGYDCDSFGPSGVLHWMKIPAPPPIPAELTRTEMNHCEAEILGLLLQAYPTTIEQIETKLVDAGWPYAVKDEILPALNFLQRVRKARFIRCHDGQEGWIST